MSAESKKLSPAGKEAREALQNVIAEVGRVVVGQEEMVVGMNRDFQGRGHFQKISLAPLTFILLQGELDADVQIALQVK